MWTSRNCTSNGSGTLSGQSDRRGCRQHVHAGKRSCSDGLNPARGIERYSESGREQFLSTEELMRLGTAIRKAEAGGDRLGCGRLNRRRNMSPSGNGVPSSARTRPRQSGYSYLPVAACVKSCTSNGGMSISSAGYCFRQQNRQENSRAKRPCPHNPQRTRSRWRLRRGWR